MEILHNRNLNIQHFHSGHVWQKVVHIYQKMPGWQGFGVDGLPYWYGNQNDETFISASLEPIGLHFLSRMESQHWEKWFEQFKELATAELEFPVGEPEDGFS